MFVLTVDQRGSRRDIDRVAQLLTEFAHRDLVRPFQRTAGDEVQAVVADPATVVDLALDLVAREHWSIGIGAGPVEEPLPAETRAGRGPAFESARVAVDRAKSAPGRVAVEGSDPDGAADADTALALVAVLVARRTEEGREAVEQMRRGATQTEAARALGISKQAVSQRLSTAAWHVETAGRRLAERLLRKADT
ncbi:SatD family protein [Rhodococcus sp. USK10]|uniref:SatD family protein n=1 Tax=Rhodococcus sp. USK10 TaxID=2789739 RepID=UPI001C6012F0|nr:SatD family protein [Rhodococcus sp. USK10]QYB04186.1 SatD family protein [Rhodococcus sp. USK10]